MQAVPVDFVGLTAVIMGCLMFLIPITGLTARFAVKPVVEAIARMREGSMDRDTIQMLERRIALLEQEVHSVSELRGELMRLVDELEFSKQLAQPKN